MAPPPLALLAGLALAASSVTAQGVDALPRRALRQAAQLPLAWPPPAASPLFPYDCAPHASNTSLLLAALADGGGDDPGAQPLPPWVADLCPEVAAHFAAFPAFPAFHRLLPISTTAYAAAGVCTLKIAAALAEDERGRTRLSLHAGSHLGALAHGGPVPWDDDVDALLPAGVGAAFLARCAAARFAVHPAVRLECVVTGGAVKVFFTPRGPANGPSAASFSAPTPLGWSAPFVDLFLFKLVAGRLEEVAADTGRLSGKGWRVGQALPTRAAYFGGLFLPAPPVALAAARYDLAACVTAPYNHRHEEWLPPRARALRLDCCALAAAGFPFVIGGAGSAAPLLVAGRAGGGPARVLDLRGWRARAASGAGAAAGAAAGPAVLDDAEAVPLVLVQAGDPAAPAPPCASSARLCGAHAVAAAAAAVTASLASVVALAWWLPGRLRPAVATREEEE